jgi:hypothetical protein
VRLGVVRVRGVRGGVRAGWRVGGLAEAEVVANVVRPTRHTDVEKLTLVA